MAWRARAGGTGSNGAKGRQYKGVKGEGQEQVERQAYSGP